MVLRNTGRKVRGSGTPAVAFLYRLWTCPVRIGQLEREKIRHTTQTFRPKQTTPTSQCLGSIVARNLRVVVATLLKNVLQSLGVRHIKPILLDIQMSGGSCVEKWDYIHRYRLLSEI